MLQVRMELLAGHCVTSTKPTHFRRRCLVRAAISVKLVHVGASTHYDRALSFMIIFAL